MKRGKKKVVVTGGAGVIGSCILKELNNKGIVDIIVVDNNSSTEKWKNLVNKKYLSYYNRTDFLDNLKQFKDDSYIIHMGVCSATTELNFEYLHKNFCTENRICFIYASSAATYGDGQPEY